jgi:hypothetical protein
MDEMRECEVRGEDEEVEYEGDYDVGEAFGDHNIEYWIYDGQRLVPASPDEEERLRDWWAMRRLETWQEQERERARTAARRVQWARFTAGLVSIGSWLPRHLSAVSGRSSHDGLAALHGDTAPSGYSARDASESVEP